MIIRKRNLNTVKRIVFRVGVGDPSGCRGLEKKKVSAAFLCKELGSLTPITFWKRKVFFLHSCAGFLFM
jgi:hypothetical protein